MDRGAPRGSRRQLQNEEADPNGRRQTKHIGGPWRCRLGTVRVIWVLSCSSGPLPMTRPDSDCVGEGVQPTHAAAATTAFVAGALTNRRGSGRIQSISDSRCTVLLEVLPLLG